MVLNLLAPLSKYSFDSNRTIQSHILYSFDQFIPTDDLHGFPFTSPSNSGKTQMFRIGSNLLQKS